MIRFAVPNPGARPIYDNETERFEPARCGVEISTRGHLPMLETMRFTPGRSTIVASLSRGQACRS